MSVDRLAETRGLPFDLHNFPKTIHTSGSDIYLPNPDTNKGVVVKVSRVSFPYVTPDEALKSVKRYRETEEIPLAMARGAARTAIVPQTYLVTEGDTPGTFKKARLQKYVQGQPLKNMGIRGIVNSGSKDIATFRSILASSMACYLKNGCNYDLVGSEENNHNFRRSWPSRFKQLVFPLGESVNILQTEKGIRIVDPNIYTPKKIKQKIYQGILFASSLANYLILSARQLSFHLHQPSFHRQLSKFFFPHY